MPVLAAVFAALAAFVGAYSLVTPGPRRGLASRLGRFDRTDAHDRADVLALPFAQRVGIPVTSRVRGWLSNILPATIVARIEKQLLVAGEPLSLYAFLGVQLAAIGAAVLGALAGLAAVPAGLGSVGVAGSAVVVALLPVLWLSSRVSERKQAILRSLPDAIDLIVTTVEAGLGIDGALAEVGAETPGPLGLELRMTVRETTLGRSRREALLRLIERTEVAELRTFVQALIQAEQTGIPIGQVLRTQAAQVRLKRRQQAEVQAQRAPVKMVLVLVTMVLPAMLLFVLGPALLRISDVI